MTIIFICGRNQGAYVSFLQLCQRCPWFNSVHHRHLSATRAVTYLFAIESRGMEDWVAAKKHLTTADKTNRRTKEGNVSDIVHVFQNESVENNFLVKNLALCLRWQTRNFTISFLQRKNYL